MATIFAKRGLYASILLMYNLCMGCAMIVSSLMMGFRGNIIINLMQEIVVLY